MKFARTLYGRLALVLFALVVAIGLLFLHFVRTSTEMYRQEVSQKLNSALAQSIAGQARLLEGGNINRAALEEIFHMLMVINPGIEVYLLDERGDILAYSAPEGKIKRHSVDLGPVTEFTEGHTRLPVTGDDPRDPSGRKIFSAARIPAEGPLEGFLYVILGGEAFDSIADMLRNSYILRSGLWWVAASLAISLLAGLLIFAVLTRRLRGLSQAVADYTAHAYPSGPRPIYRAGKSSDEIDRLGANFNAMVERIDRQMQELKQLDTTRRELVANVSHDLRTPLASLQGYLETLSLKESELDREQRAHFLQAATAQCHRLGRLIDELFELARLDSCEHLINSEPFSLGELIQDVAQKLQIKANEKGVALATAFGHDTPFAYGDIALMQRVLENLIENAIRHTPEGGRVTLSLAASGDSIAVRVSDTGRGIPRRELASVFDRFYRSKVNREGDGRHAGLGLAIVKRILELHGSSISVESVEGRGTTFFFNVPACR